MFQQRLRAALTPSCTRCHTQSSERPWPRSSHVSGLDKSHLQATPRLWKRRNAKMYLLFADKMIDLKVAARLDDNDKAIIIYQCVRYI